MRPFRSLLLLVFCLAGPVEAAAPAFVADAIADPARRRDVQLDILRHPAELLDFSRVKPGDIVVDLVPGGGYFTRILSRIVGPNGHVYAIWPDEYARIDANEVLQVEDIKRDPHYTNVTVLHQPAAQFTLPVKADLIWTSQNIHDYPDKFMGKVDIQQLDRSILRSLKPGGLFMVIDHAAETGSGLRDTERTHRIDPDYVKTQALAAGFRFDGESDVLRNPADSHDEVVFSPTIRGHTDQFVLRFKAP